jgi:hypothetical protein
VGLADIEPAVRVDRTVPAINNYLFDVLLPNPFLVGLLEASFHIVSNLPADIISLSQIFK